MDRKPSGELTSRSRCCWMMLVAIQTSAAILGHPAPKKPRVSLPCLSEAVRRTRLPGKKSNSSCDSSRKHPESVSIRSRRASPGCPVEDWLHLDRQVYINQRYDGTRSQSRRYCSNKSVGFTRYFDRRRAASEENEKRKEENLAGTSLRGSTISKNAVE